MRVTTRATLSLLAVALSTATLSRAESGLLTEPEVPQVLTPARLKQAQVDVGASVTVIDRDMIVALGVRDVPELLRLVPGMMITWESESGHTWAVNYHGTNLTDIRRLQVLVDGMSVIQPGLARILWSELALAIDDIERIEVTRGPDAAAYGANSFSGVVNIITVHPQDSTEGLARVTVGDRNILDGTLRMVGNTPDSDMRLTVTTKGDSGFDHVRGGGDARDDRRVETMNWRSEYRPGDHDRLEVQVGLVDSMREAEADLHGGLFSRYEEMPVTDTRNMNILGRWTREISADHSLQVQAYSQRTDVRNPFRSCLHPILLSDELAALSALNPDFAFGLLDAAGNPASIPAYIGSLPTPQAQAAAMAAVNTYLGMAGSGFDEICGDADLALRESRVDIEVQDTLRISEDLRLVSGASYRRDGGSSPSYLGHSVANDIWRAFAHSEYRLAEPLVLNLGAMLENDSISGTGLSPRAALNWRVADQQSLRVVSSRAERTQDLYEEYAQTRINFFNLQPLYAGQSSRDLFLRQTAPGNLRPEEINSFEVGYFGYYPALRTEVDVRVFREHLNKLISDAINPFDFDTNNDSFSELNGVEWQLRYTMAPGSWLWASYAYIDNDSSHRIERRFTALHSGSLAIARRFSDEWSGSAAWYYSLEQNRNPSQISDDNFGRLDLRLARNVRLDGGVTLEVSANAQGRFTNRPHIHADNILDDRINGYVAMQLSF